jgi:hypothetical protein
MRHPYASNMRFVQPVVLLLGAAMDILVFAVYELSVFEQFDPLWFFVIAGAWNLLMLIATIITIVDSARKIHARKTRQLATDAMVVKLASIPFFLLNFAVLAAVFIGGLAILAFGVGIALWVAVAIGSGLTYLTMLSTSVYAWAAIAQLRRERIIGRGLTVLYTLLSLVPVTDIAAAVLLFGHYRRRPRLALVVVLLSAGLLTIALGVGGLFGLFGYAPFQFPSDGGLDPAGFLSISLIILGTAMILVTGIVAVVRRSALRLEAQRAATAVDASTESTTSDLVPAG